MSDAAELARLFEQGLAQQRAGQHRAAIQIFHVVRRRGGASARLQCRLGESYEQIGDIAQGLLALLKLQQGNPDILKVANAISLHQDWDIVTAKASIATKDVVDIVNTKVAEAEEKHSSDTNSGSSK